jgi:hypothetical protein
MGLQVDMLNFKGVPKGGSKVPRPPTDAPLPLPMWQDTLQRSTRWVLSPPLILSFIMLIM